MAARTAEPDGPARRPVPPFATDGVVARPAEAPLSRGLRGLSSRTVAGSTTALRATSTRPPPTRLRVRVPVVGVEDVAVVGVRPEVAAAAGVPEGRTPQTVQ